jgi:RNA polymerase sigma-70 factor (ECF subfamily)
MANRVSDAILLERFVSRREQAAFMALVERHGPRVQGTCRRVLRNEHDVEDVFQATFLVLARKAAGIPWRESVGSWLCAVAHRLALSARADAARQNRREATLGTLWPTNGCGGRLPERHHPLVDPAAEIERRDLRRLLDDELLQLPEKYRAPVVLCDLEGRSHQEAAHQLGWPSGSISRRLERARALLRKRLVHRGVTLAVGLAAAGFLAWSITRHDGRSALAVRQAMASLKSLSDGRADGSNNLNLIVRHKRLPEPSQIITIAHRAAEVAAEIETHDPGRNRSDWRYFAVEMRTAALQLAQSAQAHDRSAMLIAAGRLDASCVKCHEVFRQ